MPAFLFLFGYNVKFSPKKIIYRWCVPYVIFQCAFIVFSRTVLNANKTFQFTTPYWILWYMLACIYYQLLLPLFDTDDKKKQIITILCAFALSLFVGYEKGVLTMAFINRDRSENCYSRGLSRRNREKGDLLQILRNDGMPNCNVVSPLQKAAGTSLCQSQKFNGSAANSGRPV